MSQTILMIISDPVERQEISVFLTHEGFDVVTAEDGFSGLEKIEGCHPEVFLMDIGLQGLNGLEISQLLRERPLFSETPIFLCSEKDDPLISEAERLAFAGRILFKPIDHALLLRSIQEQLGIPVPQKESVLGSSDVPEDNSVRIEELLGWETPSDRTSQTSSSPVSFSAPVSGPGVPPVSSEGLDDAHSSPNPRVQEALDNVWEGKGIESLIRLEPEVQPPSSVSSGSLEESARATHSTPSLPSISQEMIREMVEKTAREMIEKVVWEVVPRLAETEVKKEIERLKKGE